MEKSEKSSKFTLKTLKICRRTLDRRLGGRSSFAGQGYFSKFSMTGGFLADLRLCISGASPMFMYLMVNPVITENLIY